MQRKHLNAFRKTFFAHMSSLKEDYTIENNLLCTVVQLPPPAGDCLVSVGLDLSPEGRAMVTLVAITPATGGAVLAKFYPARLSPEGVEDAVRGWVHGLEGGSALYKFTTECYTIQQTSLSTEGSYLLTAIGVANKSVLATDCYIEDGTGEARKAAEERIAAFLNREAKHEEVPVRTPSQEYVTCIVDAPHLPFGTGYTVESVGVQSGQRLATTRRLLLVDAKRDHAETMAKLFPDWKEVARPSDEP